MTKVVAVISIALTLLGTTAVQTSSPDLPPLDLESVLQGPDALSWESLEGQAVIIEFWATWCMPCVAAIPHWNDLVEAFEGEPVRFLSISDEKVGVVKTFLQHREIAGWVATDFEGTTTGAFGINYVPQTILIDSEGAVRARTYPQYVDEKSIHDLIAGREPDVRQSETIDRKLAVALAEDGGPEPLLRVEIRPSTTIVSGGRSGSGLIVLTRARVAGVLPTALDVRSSRLVIECDLPDQTYDFRFEAGNDEALLNKIMPEAVLSSFNLVAEKEVRRVDVMVLKASSEARHRLQPVEEEYGASTRIGSRISGPMEMAGLAHKLESPLKKPVLDETGLDGLFDVDLEWDPEDGTEGIRAAVTDQLGLVLTEEQRDIEVVVVRDATTE